MTTVLGVSVGTSAVRLARQTPDLRAGNVAAFRHRVVSTDFDQAERLAAESIGTMLSEEALSEGSDPEAIAATGVAYRDDAQAGAMAQAMAKQHIANYRLIPEVHAALSFLQASGELVDATVVALYDLGSSGLSVSIVDLHSGEVVTAERSLDVSGNMFDALIRDNQLGRQQGSFDVSDDRDFELRCCSAKERLSTSGAVALPGPGGLILVSREAFESMIIVPVETSARMVRDVIANSGRTVDAIILIGGGSNIPLVRETLSSWTGLRLITPAEPELVAAKGAALLATPVNRPSPDHAPAPDHAPIERPVDQAPVVQAPVVQAPVVPLPAEPEVVEKVEVNEPTGQADSARTYGPLGMYEPERSYEPDLPRVPERSYEPSDTYEPAEHDEPPQKYEPEQAYAAVPAATSSIGDSRTGVAPSVVDPRTTNTPSWLSGAPDDHESARPRSSRWAMVAAGVLALIAAVGIAFGYGSTRPTPASESTPVTTTVAPTTQAPTTTTLAPTTTLPPPTTTPAPAAPAETQSNGGSRNQAPAQQAPAPAPAPPPLIPGLPQIQLPVFQLPPLPVIPGF